MGGKIEIYNVNPETHNIYTGLPTGSYCQNCGGYDYTLKNYETKKVCNYCKKRYPDKFKEED